MIDLSKYRSFDTETLKFRSGEFRSGDPAPRIICASTAEVVSGETVKIRGQLVYGWRAALDVFRQLLRGGYTVLYANAAYDLAVAAQHDPLLLAEIFRAIEEERVHDILIAQSLDAIFGGHLGLDPRTGQELRHPDTGKSTKRYSLAICTDLVLGRVDAKKNDVWRESYGLLEGFPVEEWPYEARQYPVDDAENTLEVGLAQIFDQPGAHAWQDVPAIPGVCPAASVCRHCGLDAQAAGPRCAKAPRVGPHRNLGNLSFQVAADFAYKLGAAHGLRTDPEKVAELGKYVEEKYAAAVARFQKKGWIREDGTEDEAAVKRAIALAYGARGTCSRCRGGVACRKCDGRGAVDGARCGGCGGLGHHPGKVRSFKVEDCRGEKVRGRLQGCKFDGLGGHCGVCGDTGKVKKVTGEKLCKNVFDDSEVLVEEGCDGTGLDLSQAKFLDRTDKMGVKTDRDTKMESGDDDISDYGEDEHNKARTTYYPYLLTGVDGPLYYSANVIVATGRGSLEHSPLHQMPRQGRERGCLRARGAWCGYPLETIFGSTDYEAGELCALSQWTYWLFGYSQMRDAINNSGKPGILHSDLAAQVMGISLDEFLVRLKERDKTAVDFRQASKPYNFGKPAGMGTPNIVATNRKKSAGFTVCEGGPAENADGQEGYWGIRFCVLIGGAKKCGVDKILEWGKKKPYRCAPVCKACCDIVQNVLEPAYFTRYPEIRDYFTWVGKRIDAGEPALSCVWDAEAQRPRIVRERGGCDFSAFANNAFQSLLAEIMKHAYVRATKECYLGVRKDGSPSPLAGCRLPVVMHDEPLSELILDYAHVSGPRIAEIMVESGQQLAPHVVWKAETALAFWYSKKMEPVYDPTGKLSPWGPVPDYLQSRFETRAAA